MCFHFDRRMFGIRVRGFRAHFMLNLESVSSVYHLSGM